MLTMVFGVTLLIGFSLQLNVIRGLAWFFRKVWRSIYRQVEINEDMLKTVLFTAYEGLGFSY